MMLLTSKVILHCKYRTLLPGHLWHLRPQVAVIHQHMDRVICVHGPSAAFYH